MTDRQNVLPLPAELLLLETLPSLQSTLFDLRALLRSPYPPRSLYIHAPSNLSLVRNVIRVSLPCPSSSCSDIDDVKADRTRRPHIQDLLPRACFVDCAELASQKALFARILNTLSGWGTGEWNEAIGGVLNWDGRQEDWSVRRSRRGSRKGRDASDEVLYEIVWDYTAAAARAATSSRGLLEERKDESSSGFLDGLRALYALGAGNPPATRMPTTTTKKPSNGKDSEREDVPRFIVIENADRLSSLESLPVGQSEGTLLAVVMRLGELTGKPIVPILVSSSEWLLLRPNRGATEPAATIEMPTLGKRDIVSCVVATLISTSPQALSSSLEPDRALPLARSLVDLLFQTFEPYLGVEVADYIWMTEKCWPGWIERVESGQVADRDINRLVALFKGRLTHEIEQLSELRPLAVSSSRKRNQNEEEEEEAPYGKPSGVTFETQVASSHATLTRQDTATTSPSLQRHAGFSEDPFQVESYLGSPSAMTPSRRSYQQATASQQLPVALSTLGKYLVIAAYLASSNPSKKDVLMVATAEDEFLASKSKKRKRGGGTRKTAIKVNGDGSLAGPNRKENIPQRFLGPKPFPLERLLAICECILPVELRGLAKSTDMLQQVATLTNIRLLVKTSGSNAPSQYSSAGAAVSAFDRLDGVKLKCNNLELEMVEAIGKSVGFKVSERLWEAMP